MIHCEATSEIAAPQASVFAFVDDFAKAPQWLGMCQSLELVAPPKRAGSKIRYAYKEGGGTRNMEGNLSAYDSPRRIELALQDKMFALLVRFELESRAQGTHFKYTLEITPQSFVAKLMSGMIRGATQKQVDQDVAKLKSLLEAR